MNATDRYLAAAHAMQSGVAMEMEMADRPQPTEPKHLRVGINTAMADHAALVTLLMEKNIITLDEYHEALANAMEAEQRRYEAHLSELLGGKKVTLA